MVRLLLGIAILSLPPAPDAPPSAADKVTLRDGKTVLGQILESERRGPLMMIVRRAWAEKNVPDHLARWERTEAPIVQRAESQRRERLEAWKRDRQTPPRDGDRVGPWIDRELSTLARPGDPPRKSPLMIVRLGRSDVKMMDRKSRQSNRLLRLGWLSDFPDVETMSVAELTQAVEGRGYSPTSDLPVAVDGLLPIPAEDDSRWLIRRAATEVIQDPGARLLRYQGLVMAEPAAGEAPPAGAALNAALGGLKELLGEETVDPLPGKLRELARQGRVGAVVTQLQIAADLSSTSVDSTLWVRMGERWFPSLSRSGIVRVGDIPANAGDGLADDPQVKAVFGVVESLGLGSVPPEFKQRSLNMGAATRQALGQARGAMDQELNAAALALGTSNPAPVPSTVRP